MDNPDSDNLTYTSYENNGKVNQYTENDDGGHSHYLIQSEYHEYRYLKIIFGHFLNSSYQVCSLLTLLTLLYKKDFTSF